MTNLVWITPEAQKHIAFCARVSNPENQHNPETTKLLKYCIKHGHWSVFEMASMCVEIKTTRAISAQILRHRSFSFQEFSQRYAAVDVESIGDINIRVAGTTNRQSSIVADLTNEQMEAVAVAEHLRGESFAAYKELVRLGIATECARMYLPLSTKTTIYMTGTIRSFIHYVMLRCKMDTQQEHRDIAIGINNILWDNLPQVMQAVEEHWV